MENKIRHRARLRAKRKKGWRNHMEKLFSKVERFAGNVANWMTIIVTSKMLVEWFVERWLS